MSIRKSPVTEAPSNDISYTRRNDEWFEREEVFTDDKTLDGTEDVAIYSLTGDTSRTLKLPLAGAVDADYVIKVTNNTVADSRVLIVETQGGDTVNEAPLVQIQQGETWVFRQDSSATYEATTSITLNSIISTIQSQDILEDVNILKAFQTRTIETISADSPITKEFTAADPTTGDITATLPLVAESQGQQFIVMRTVNGGNVVRVSVQPGDTINDSPVDFILSKKNEVLVVQADPSGWHIIGEIAASQAGLKALSAPTYIASTSYALFDVWDTSTESAPQKLEAIVATDSIDVLNHKGVGAERYVYDCTISLEGDKDKYIMAKPYFNSVTGTSVAEVAVNGLGSGKPVTITMHGFVDVPSNGQAQIYLMSESNQSLSIISAVFTLSKYRG